MSTFKYAKGTRARLWLLTAVIAGNAAAITVALLISSFRFADAESPTPAASSPRPVVIVTLPPPACEGTLDVAGIRLPCEATVDARDDGATTVVVAKMPTAGWTTTRQMLAEDGWAAESGGVQRWTRDGNTLAAALGVEDDQVEVTLTITRNAPPQLPPELAEPCTDPPPDQQAGCDLLELLYDSAAEGR